MSHPSKVFHVNWFCTDEHGTVFWSRAILLGMTIAYHRPSTYGKTNLAMLIPPDGLKSKGLPRFYPELTARVRTTLLEALSHT